MKKLIFFAVILSVFTLSAYAQTTSPVQPVTVDIPEGFKSDNCTSFPDGDYADCCFDHDLAYFKGGSWKERWRADKKLYKCVAAKSGFKHKFIAPIMWLGVRAFGVPWIPTSARWGFGKDIEKAKKAKEKK
jgi:predicted small secreted protein